MTYDLMKAEAIYKAKVADNEHYDHQLVINWKTNMPDEFAKKMYEEEYGHHIFDEEFYDKATSYLVNQDESKGPHWSLAAIKEEADINFNEEHFNLYDYAYVVNMLYSDYGDILIKPATYLRMAHNYLTDKDFFGKPEERAYYNACKRIKYFEHK